MDLHTEKDLFLIASEQHDKVDFIQNLVLLFGKPLKRFNNIESFLAAKINNSIILWTPSCAPETVSNLSYEKSNFHLLINADKKNRTETQLLEGGYQGIFYQDDPAPLIIRGLNTVSRGELWFSRKTLSEIMINQFALNQTESAELCPGTVSDFEKLTLKERQIVHRLVSGARNKEIANSLKISEHTVKTHLYNIYKKINASNRVQAINLGRKVLPWLQAV